MRSAVDEVRVAFATDVQERVREHPLRCHRSRVRARKASVELTHDIEVVGPKGADDQKPAFGEH
eukprot:3012530-Pleurochrysis_carterae.AAC.1